MCQTSPSDVLFWSCGSRCCSALWCWLLRVLRSWNISWWTVARYKMSRLVQGIWKALAQFSSSRSIFKPWDALTGVCVGGPAPSSGRLRCFDSPQPQAGSPAQPGSGPSHCQLQQGRHEWQCGPVRGAPACHWLQPCGPLCGGAQSECYRFGVLKGALGLYNTLWMHSERKVMSVTVERVSSQKFSLYDAKLFSNNKSSSEKINTGWNKGCWHCSQNNWFNLTLNNFSP